MVYFNEDQIERWVTINGARTPILKDGSIGFSRLIDADFDKKQKQLNRSFEDREIQNKNTLADDFTKKTGIPIDDKFLQNCHYSNLKDICYTIQTLKEQYKNLDIKSISEMLDEDKSDDTAAGMGSSGTLFLNSDIYKYPRSVIDETYKESVKEGSHPNGDASSIIAHEIGHRLIDNRIKAMVTTPGRQGAIEASFIDTYFKNMHYNENLAKKYPTYKMIGTKINELLAKYKVQDIGSYALKNYHEMCAEAFADVWYNKDKASALSKELYNLMIGG